VTWASISIGSNTRSRENFSSCLDMLLLQFHDLALSSVYESTADGGGNALYLNMAAAFETELTLAELVQALKHIEDKHGRLRSTEPNSEVTLDLDLLTYGDKAGNFDGIVLPHPDIITKAYVLWPLAQIAGKRKHPLAKLSYAELRQQLPNTPALKAVGFEWHGRVLSKPA
jgi:2-amino-4-hydroxy-6-hydroxymethyldihydropteridine diphosphokinase